MNRNIQHEVRVFEAISLFERYEAHGDVTALRRAIAVLKTALKGTTIGDAKHRELSGWLCVMQGQLFTETGDRRYIDIAVAAGQASVGGVNKRDKDLPARSWYLGVILLLRFDGVVPEQQQDLDDAVRHLSYAVARTGQDEPDRVRRHADLASALSRMWTRTEEPEYLDRMISVGQAAVENSDPDDPDLTRAFLFLAEGVQAKFALYAGEVANDLAGAVEWLRRIASATAEHHPDRAERWVLFCLVQMARRAHSAPGDTSVLDDLVGAGEQVVDATQQGAADRAGRLIWLALALQDRYVVTEQRPDLERWIVVAREALASGAGDAADPMSANLLGTALVIRFELSGNERDVDEAIALLGPLTDPSPDDSVDRAAVTAVLSDAWRQKFARSGEFAFLDRAVDLLLPALTAALGDEMSDHEGCLINLTNALVARFEHTSKGEDLARALAAARRACELAPESRAAINALGWALMVSTKRSDNDEAVELMERLVKAEPASSLSAAKALTSLGGALRHRYNHFDDPRDLDRAVAIGEQLVKTTPKAHLMHAALLANLGMAARTRYDRRGDPSDWRVAAAALQQAAESSGSAVERMRGAMNYGLSLAKQQVWDQAADAFAGALALVPELASAGLRRETREHWLSTLSDLARNAAACAIHAGEAERAVALLEQGRGVLLAEALASIEPTPAGDGSPELPGPVVLLNLSGYRSDAVIRTGRTIEVVPLPLATLSDTGVQVERFLRLASRRPGKPVADRVLTEVLDWLWRAVVEPVLERLGFTQAHDQLPRVWWVPTGLLGFLPIHAAQHRGTGAMDYVVSSYAPTLRALQRKSAIPATPGRALVVAMPETPGKDPLRHTGEEADAVAAHAVEAEILRAAEATRSNVLARLHGCSWAHFACHGGGNVLDPSSSRLLLHDHERRPFTAADISALRLENADLAFLSACSTATPGLRIPDEAIHLGSAFQAAGFRHVVATLWPVLDPIAARVSRDFYRNAAAGSDGPARALHTALERLRKDYPENPTLWAAHTHLGG
ncbi:CHAT domain-containing protein [Amycolatopsis sp. NPDC051903]|uniref:CHAT domain-containing protein n=1 Tax=Amycolatopsis sp. NPDC051903 TaxID=3363936 RepID=UPI00378E4148